MSSNFARLYKQLSKQTYDSLPNDMEYNFERQELLYTLGYDVAHKDGPKAVTRGTHHGKNVRKIRDERPISKWGTTVDPHEVMEKRRVVQSVAKSGTELSKITRQMSKTIENRQLPENLVQKLLAHDDRATLSLMKASIVSPVKIYNPDSMYNTESPTLPPIKKPSCKKGEGIRQDINCENKHVLVNTPSIINRSYSKQKWSPEERLHLNQLYNELPLPTNKKIKELWDLYLEGFAQRFVLTHPKRCTEEIIIKVKEMIHRKQFKDTDAVEQWGKIVSHRNSRGAGKLRLGELE